MALNKVLLIGNLTRDPELKFTTRGTAVCSLSVASNRRWKDDSGAEKEEVTFVDVTAFGKTGEVIAQYFRKGSPIFIEGRLKLDQWDDKTTGQKRSKMGVVLETFEFMGGKREEGGSAAPTRPASQSAPSAKPATAAGAPAAGSETPEEDDVPF